MKMAEQVLAEANALMADVGSRLRFKRRKLKKSERDYWASIVAAPERVRRAALRRNLLAWSVLGLANRGVWFVVSSKSEGHLVLDDSHGSLAADIRRAPEFSNFPGPSSALSEARRWVVAGMSLLRERGDEADLSTIDLHWPEPGDESDRTMLAAGDALVSGSIYLRDLQATNCHSLLHRCDFCSRWFERVNANARCGNPSCRKHRYEESRPKRDRAADMARSRAKNQYHDYPLAERPKFLP